MPTPALASSLLRDGLISDKELQEAAGRMSETREGLLETLADLKYPKEEKILAFLSDKNGCPNMSVGDASKVQVSEKMRKLISGNFAKQYNAIPMSLDGEASKLKLLMLDPTDSNAGSFLAMAAGVAGYLGYQVVPSVVEALYRRYYEGNIEAFSASTGIMSSDVEWFLRKYAAMYRIPISERDVEMAWLNECGLGHGQKMSQREPEIAFTKSGSTVNPQFPFSPQPGGHNPTAGSSPIPPNFPPPPVRPHGMPTSIPQDWQPGSQPAPISFPVVQQSVPPAMTSEPVIQLTNIWESSFILPFLRNFMITADENHPLGSGHSVKVADRCLSISKRLNLAKELQQKLAFASLIHDLGIGTEHLTVLNIAQSEELKKRARLTFRFLIDNFEDMPIPTDVVEILLSRFEHFDGGGFPKGKRDEETPVGSKILTVVDAYTDLVDGQNYSPDEAISEMQKYGGKILDPIVIAALSAAVGTATGAFASVALVYSSDPILCGELDKLSAIRLQVITAASVSTARYRLANAIARVVLIDLDDNPEEALDFVEDIIKKGFVNQAVLVFIASQLSSEHREKIKRLPASAIMKKPFSVEELSQRLKELMEKGSVIDYQLKKLKDRASASKPGDSSSGEPHSQTPAPDDKKQGSLSEKPLPALMRRFYHERVTGRLTLVEGENVGELYFDNGKIVHAIIEELTGDAAFVKIVKMISASWWFENDTLVLETAIKRPMEQLIAYAEKILGIMNK